MLRDYRAHWGAGEGQQGLEKVGTASHHGRSEESLGKVRKVQPRLDHGLPVSEQSLHRWTPTGLLYFCSLAHLHRPRDTYPH